MAKKPEKPRKVRVEFRQNRAARRRHDDWTRLYNNEQEKLLDHKSVESVRAKGDLSRKRTILVNDADQPVGDERLWRTGVVVAVLGLTCRVEDEHAQTWECSVRRVVRTRMIEQRAAVAVGDRVWFSPSSAAQEPAVGVVERVAPRTTILSRKEFRGREHILVANAEQLLIVASVRQPTLKPHLVDRYLVAAGRGNLRPIICLNKWDLLAPSAPKDAAAPDDPDPADDEDSDEWLSGPLTVDEVADEYRALGYRVIPTSAETGLGLEELRAELKGRLTVLSGQSGVGKSSLLNRLQPGLGLAVQAVSNENEKGRHTTTHAQLLRLNCGGHVVDTPGIRQFDLWSVPPGELEALFTEFGPLLAECRFNDCHHIEEQGCAVRAAADAGTISARRYASYRKMLGELARTRDGS